MEVMSEDSLMRRVSVNAPALSFTTSVGRSLIEIVASTPSFSKRGTSGMYPLK